MADFTTRCWFTPGARPPLRGCVPAALRSAPEIGPRSRLAPSAWLLVVGIALALPRVPAADADCRDPALLFRLPATSYAHSPAITVVTADFNSDGILDLAAADGGQLVAVQLGTGANGVGDGGFGPVVNYRAGINPVAIAVGDFNHDGILDLAVANQTSGDVTILRGRGTAGRGDGTFVFSIREVLGGAPSGVAAGDFNHDGITDLVVTDQSDASVGVMIGRGSNGIGDGTFDAPVSWPAGPGSAAIAVSDLNGDGIQDLAVVDTFAGAVAILLGGGAGGAGDGTFAAPVLHPVGPSPRALLAADLNRDGITDLVATLGSSSSIAVLMGNGSGGVGDGTFAPATLFPAGNAPRGIAVADFDADGIPDLLVADQSASQVALLHGQGAGGVFAAPALYASAPGATGVAIGDFNGDGLPDASVVGSSGGLFIHFG